MDRETFTVNKFTLLKFPHSTDDLIAQRIDSLNKLICESSEDEHVNKIIEMIISHLNVNYEGLYVEYCTQHLLNAIFWWKECYDPSSTLAAAPELEE